MSMDGGYTIEVTNLSPRATENDLYNFFSFSGQIKHVEIIRHGDYACAGYVTFKEPYALETAVLLSGATIVDQPVCISRWGQCEEPCNFWERSWKLDDDAEYTGYNSHQFSTTPSEAFTVAQDMVKTMIAKGYTLSKDALIRAKELDEAHKVSSTAAAKVAELSKRVGLTDKINAGIDTAKSMDRRYHVSETTKTLASDVGGTAVRVKDAIVSSSYFSAGALMVSGALNRAAKYAADLATHGSKK